MIKKDTVYLSDIAKQPFIDIMFYQMFNSFTIDKTGLHLNPFKWSLFTLYKALCICFSLILLYTVGLIMCANDVRRLRKLYSGDDYKGFFQSDVSLLREFKN